MLPKLVGINHVALEVDSIDEALEFYGRFFELHLRGVAPGMAFIDLGDQFLALSERREQGPDQGRHFGLVVDDKEAVRAALEAADDVEVEPGRRLDFRDPWGNRVEIVDYRDIQFTKAPPVLRAWGSTGSTSASTPSSSCARRVCSSSVGCADRSMEAHDDEAGGKQTSALEALLYEERALRAVLEGLPDATVATGRDERIVFVNAHAETLFGYEHGELLGRPVQTLWPEAVRDRYTRNMQLYFATEHPLRFTIRADGLRRDGTEFVGEMSWGIVETEAGPLLLAIGRDMTVYREAMARLQRQSAQAAAVAGLGERALSGADVGDLAVEAVERMRETLSLDLVEIRRAGELLAGWGHDGGSWPGSRSPRGTRCSARSAWRARSGRTRRASCARSRTCSRRRWGGCAARSRCVTRRCTTR